MPLGALVLLLHIARADDAATPQPAALHDVVIGGWNAYRRGDYDIALRLLTEASQHIPADDDSALATSILGDMYESGKGVARDERRALELFAAAAAAGNVGASYNVGVLADRIGDYPRALAGYRFAAEKGSARVQALLGTRYYYGRGVERDDAAAVEWFRKSAAQHDAYGEFWLGVANDAGIGGLPKNDVEAARWYLLSAQQGYAFAQANLGVSYATGRGVEQDYAAAVRWFRPAAEQDVASAIDGYGYSLDKGYGIAQDEAAAIKWYRRAAQYGQPNAMHNLADHYLDGIGVEYDKAEAYYWALLAERYYAEEPSLVPQKQKREAVHNLRISLEAVIEESERSAIEQRAASFKPKKPPAPDMPSVQSAVLFSSIRDRLQRDANFRLYSAVFAVKLDADDEVLSLQLVKVVDPASGSDEPVEVTVPTAYVDAVRLQLSRHRPSGVDPGKAASFFVFYYYSPTYPATVITDLDAPSDPQP